MSSRASRKRLGTAALVAAVSLLGPFQVLQAQSADTEKTRPPPGFEDLTGPQPIVADVFFGDRKLGFAGLVHTPDSLSLDDPAAVARLIPRVEEAAVVATALAGELARNDGLVCRKPNVPRGCETLSPSVAAVIFDEQRFRLHVFVNPEYLRPTGLADIKYLPESTADGSAVTAISGTLSGETGDDIDYDVVLTSRLGHGQFRYTSETSYSRDDRLRLNRAVAQYDWAGAEALGGLFRLRDIRLVGQPEMLGIRLASSLRTRVDLERAFGSELTLFLARRAKVDILRDGRLLSSRFYDAGNQVLDTAPLPEGAYEITLRIDDPVTGERTEDRFFTKSFDIPPPDAPSWTVEAGVARSRDDAGPLPKLTATPVARIGAGTRIHESMGIDFDLVGAPDVQIASSGLQVIVPALRVRAGGIATPRGDYGAEAFAALTYEGVTATVSARRLWTDSDINADDRPRLDLIGEPFSTVSGNIGARIGKVDIGVRGRWRRSKTADVTSVSWSATPYLRSRLFQNADMLGFLDVEATQSDSETFALVRFSLQTLGENWTLSGSVAGQAEKPEALSQWDPEHVGNAGVTWRDGTLWDAKVQARARLRRSQTRDSLSLEGLYSGDHGLASLAIEPGMARGGRERSISYGAELALNLVATGDNIAVGGRDLVESGVVVALAGAPRGGRFTVIVDGRATASIGVGQSVILPLDPYETYSIEIAPREDTFARYDAAPRVVTLYPGNVQPLTWRVTRSVILVTQVIDEAGTPLADAVVDDGTARTDANGFLQLEIAVEDEASVSLTDPNGATCIVTVSVPDEAQGVFVVDQASCRAATEAP